MIRRIRLAVAVGLFLCLAATLYQAERARAAGIPLTNTLYYTGSLLTFGAPDNSTHNIAVDLFIAGETTSAACNTATTSVTCVNGQFSLALPPACVPIVHANPNLLVQVTIDGITMGMSPLAAVPFAVEADTASNAAAGSSIATQLSTLTNATATANIVTNGASRNWSDGTYARTCYYYLNSPSPHYVYAGATGSGVYTIQPDGPGGSPAFNIYCDMTNQGGGWTLAVGISGTTYGHLNTAAVNPGNLVSPTGVGKLADAEINNLKSGINPGYRFTCGTITGYFESNCEFIATVTATGTCAGETYTYPPTAYGLTRFVQSGETALADGDSSTNDRLIYANTGSGAPGCDTGVQHWNQNGTVWVR